MRAILSIFLLIAVSSTAQAEEIKRFITVTGLGEIAAAPDMARVNLGVEVTSRTAGDALAENSKRVTALIDVLRAAGIAEKDMQTTQLNLHPRWEQRNNSGTPPRVIGYTAQNMLQLRIRAIDQLGEVLDQVTRAGSNRINHIGFELSDPAPLLDEARRQAVANARHKAELLAGAAGVVLGDVISINEGGARSNPAPRAHARMEAAMAVPIAEGEISTRASVTIVYELK